MARLLYVEDDVNLAFITKYNLEQQGLEVIHCENGAVALDTFRNGSFDLCLLDVMLPGMDGFELAKRIRQLNIEIPIIFLTVKAMTEDKIYGLRLGADDYITKPFHSEELLLKIQVFLKRTGPNQKNKNGIIKIGTMQFDQNALSLKNEQEKFKLTFKEAELLRYFYSHRNNVLKREEILMAVWGNDDYFLGRSLDVFISRLRKYFSGQNDVKIENIHGIGFRMSVC